MPIPQCVIDLVRNVYATDAGLTATDGTTGLTMQQGQLGLVCGGRPLPAGHCTCLDVAELLGFQRHGHGCTQALAGQCCPMSYAALKAVQQAADEVNPEQAPHHAAHKQP